MSNLLPNVDLDTEEDKEESATETQKGSSTEEQNYTSTEEQNDSSVVKQKDSSVELQNTAASTVSELPVHPAARPDLNKKLGPYVSDATSDALEEVFLQMRRHYGSDVSKSLIVEAALRYLLSDSLEHGTNSELSNWLDQLFSESKDAG